MKSSTLYRSNLSREKLQQLEGFKTRAGQHVGISYEENTPNVYVRPQKERDLDTLLGSFNISTAKEKTPAVYLVSGFLVGAICMLLMTAFVTLSAKREASLEDIYTVPMMEKDAKGLFTKKEKKIISPVTIIPADNPVVEVAPEPKAETYTVKSGDTLEAIIIRFYGRFDVDKVAQIATANKMNNPNALQIGQKLIIPME